MKSAVGTVILMEISKTVAVEGKTHESNDELNDGEIAPRYSWVLWGAIAVWLVIAGVIGFWLGSNRVALPSDASSEAGFARDMSFHHSNAIEMALLLRDHTEDEMMRFLALDIALTQQAQIGQMQGWLNVWGLPSGSLEPAMTWMGMPVNGLMPGIATSDEVNNLRNLRGVEADITFLNLMIRHHQSGVEMARAVLEMTDRPEVVNLARSILTSQEAEIATMRDILQRKGGLEDTPESAMPGMNHSGDGN